MEKIHTVQYSVTPLHADCFGRCRPSALLRFSQDAAGEHCNLLGAGSDILAEKHFFWAVIRQRMEITRLPVPGQTITVKTWPMPATRTAWPRAVEGFDQEGNSLFRVISLWVIMDRDSRAMVLPGKNGVHIDGVCMGTELKVPGGLPAEAFPQTCLRDVRFSDLDSNGHMNNTRYLDWLCDLLPADFHREHPLKAVTLCYMREALEGQTLHLGWSGQQILRLDGTVSEAESPSGHTRIFSAEAVF